MAVEVPVEVSFRGLAMCWTSVDKLSRVSMCEVLDFPRELSKGISREMVMMN